MRKKMRMKDKVFRLLLAFLFVFNVGFSATNLVFASTTNFIHVHLSGYGDNTTVDVVFNDESSISLDSKNGKLYTTPDNKKYVTDNIKGIKVNGNFVDYETGVEAKGTVNYWIGYDELPYIKIDKSVSPTTAKPGDEVTYTMKVSSNVDLTDVNITDDDLALTGFNGEIGGLTADNEVERTGTYVVPSDAQSDISNTASVTGNYDDETELTDEDTAVLKVEKVNNVIPTIEIEKSVSPTSAKPGDTVTYTMKVTSNVKLTDVSITDDDLTLTGFDGNIGNLTADTPVQRTGTYVVPSEADPGSTISNTASVTGKYEGATVSDTDNVLLTVKEPSIDPTPQIELKKSVYPTSAKPGETVTYTMKVTSNVNLTGVKITDTDIALNGFNGDVGDLTANTPVEKTGTYVVPSNAQSDINNTALVTGKYGDATVSDTDTAVLKVDQGNPPQPVPGLSITKTADRSSAHRGNTINYTITVKNTGDTDLGEINVTDGMLDFNRSISLKSGQSTTFDNLEYVVPNNQPYGKLTNTATASCDDLNASDSVNVQIIQRSSGGGGGSTTIDEGTTPLGEAKLPALSVTKTVDKALAAPGDKVKYSITVKNSGNVDLVNVAVTDQLVGLNETIASLKAGDSKTFTKDYVIPQNAAGSIKNTAVAEAVYNGTKVSADGSAVTNIEEQIIEDNTPLGDAKFPTETINDDKTPLAEAKLPKTGGIPMSDLVVLGSGLAALGLVIRRKR